MCVTRTSEGRTIWKPMHIDTLEMCQHGSFPNQERALCSPCEGLALLCFALLSVPPAVGGGKFCDIRQFNLFHQTVLSRSNLSSFPVSSHWRRALPRCGIKLVSFLCSAFFVLFCFGVRGLIFWLKQVCALTVSTDSIGDKQVTQWASFPSPLVVFFPSHSNSNFPAFCLYE